MRRFPLRGECLHPLLMKTASNPVSLDPTSRSDVAYDRFMNLASLCCSARPIHLLIHVNS